MSPPAREEAVEDRMDGCAGLVQPRVVPAQPPARLLCICSTASHVPTRSYTNCKRLHFDAPEKFEAASHSWRCDSARDEAALRACLDDLMMDQGAAFSLSSVALPACAKATIWLVAHTCNACC